MANLNFEDQGKVPLATKDGAPFNFLKGDVCPNFIDNEFVYSKSEGTIVVNNPATQDVIAKAPQCTAEERAAIVDSCAAAYPKWSELSAQKRVRYLLTYQHLLREHMPFIAEIISSEHGKTLDDAKGDVFRGLELCEQACAVCSNMNGSFTDNIATNMDAYSMRQPLGIVAGICPFNFAAMIPLWMFPLAIATGNTFVLKPSERVPQTSVYLMRLVQLAGFPAGVINMVHGALDTVNFLCDEPRVKAISFVGSCRAGEAIYKRANANGKRVQANMGAKNHAVVMPDADKDQVLNGLIGAAFGAAGQRCMALSVAVFVGRSKEWMVDLADRASKLNVTCFKDPKADLGPVISPQQRDRILAIVERAKAAGVEIPLDGTGFKNEAYPNGNFVGPTLLGNVKADMECYKEEIFGPVLCCMYVDTLEEAIAVTNANPFGNGTCIYTTMGAHARKFQHEIEVGLIGVNVPIPVPLPFYSWSSAKASFRGEDHLFGDGAVRFFTRVKTVMTAWKPLKDGGAEQHLNFPVGAKN